jgi:hypothetical protein
METTERIVDSVGNRETNIGVNEIENFQGSICEDPFKNIIDIQTHGDEYLWILKLSKIGFRISILEAKSNE